MKVELQLQARNLKSFGFGLPDAYAVVSRLPLTGDPDHDEIGETEVMEKALDPQWEKVFLIDIEPSSENNIRVSVVDQTQHDGSEISLGHAVFDLSEVLHTEHGEMLKSLECGGSLLAEVRKSDATVAPPLMEWNAEKPATKRRGTMMLTMLAPETEEEEPETNEEIAKQWILQERNAAKRLLESGSVSQSRGSIDSPTHSATLSPEHDDSQSLQMQSHANTISTTADTYRRAAWINLQDHAAVLVFGQILSFLFASAGAAQASLYLRCEMSAPAFTLGIMYLLLSLNLVPVMLKARRRRNVADSPYSLFGSIPLRAPVRVYWLLAFLHVGSGYATLTSFRFTTMTSILLFDSLSVPSAMLMSRLLLSRRYMAVHILGAGFCMSGMLYNVFSDYVSDKQEAEFERLQEEAMDEFEKESYTTGAELFPNMLVGDILAIVGALLSGINDVLAEVSVRSFGGPLEFLGMIGLFGSVISFIQAAIFERGNIVQLFESSEDGTCSTTNKILLLLGMVVANAVRYMGTAQFLLWSEATMLNLSFVTVVLWSIVFSVFVQHIVPEPLFYVALTMMISGVLVYAMGPSPIQEHSNERPLNVLVPRGDTNLGIDRVYKEKNLKKSPEITLL